MNITTVILILIYIYVLILYIICNAHYIMIFKYVMYYIMIVYYIYMIVYVLIIIIYHHISSYYRSYYRSCFSLMMLGMHMFCFFEFRSRESPWSLVLFIIGKASSVCCRMGSTHS